MTSTHSKEVGLLALYGSIVLLALNGLFSKVIPLDATSMTQARCVVASFVLFLALVLQGSPLKLPSFKQALGVYGLGILVGAHWITYFHSMKISSVAIGMLSLFSYPVLTVIIEPLYHGARAKAVDILAACGVFLGVFLLVSEDILAGNFSEGTVQGAIWGIASAVFFSLRNTTQKYYFKDLNSTTLMAHQTLAVAIILLPFLSIGQLSQFTFKDSLLLILLGCFSTALAHTLLSLSLKHLKAKTVALVGCLLPLVGIMLAWLVLGERPSTMVYLGGFMILSVAIFETLKQK